MEIKSYQTGHDSINNIWYISFELQNGEPFDRWKFQTEIECSLMIQLLKCQDALSLSRINEVLVLEGVNQTANTNHQ